MSSLYLHIPFCRRRCPYCDFYSTTAGPAERAAYVDHLVRHLEMLGCTNPQREALQTIYFGGGTPSLLTAGQLAGLLMTCRDLFGISTVAEITLEVNPGTFQGDYLHQVRQAGCNRLSIGIQSFSAEQLQRLGRCHDVAQARDAVVAARRAGFANISLDLMFALPGQQQKDLRREIEQILEHQPEHISVYGLTIEEGTEFARLQHQGELSEVDEDEYAAQYELLRERLAAAGYEHYEVSNFARPGYRCRHNQVYWQRRSCFAVGCGAHSFVDQGYGERRVVPADLRLYGTLLAAGRDPAEVLETFDQRGAMIETLYLALRTRDGLDLAAFEQRFGVPLAQAFPAALAQLREVLVITPERLVLPPQHWLIYDHHIAAFFEQGPL